MNSKIIRAMVTAILALSLTGCIYWVRAYQTYLQMSEFDRYFNVSVTDDFTLHFKEPIMLSQDFVSLSKLYCSLDTPNAEGGRHWRYWFRKMDAKGNIIKPEIKFYSDLNFNKEGRITAWSFSHLFLAIAPPEFLEVSLRSIGGAEINKDKMQLKANASAIEKITAPLPQKANVIAQLGEPLEIQDDHAQEIYVYHFQLETNRIEPGYEERALSEVKLSFDKKTQEMVRMAGRFAGLKISINYRKFIDSYRIKLEEG
ncbi:MAG: hypothetical protein ABL925_10765 [Methylococcales bacterium]